MRQPSPSAIADASWAIGRLSAAVERSPIGPLWLSHETAQVVSRLFSRGAEPLGADELLAIAAGTSEGVPSLPEMAARRFWSNARRLWRTPVQTGSPHRANVLDITNRLAALAAGDMPPGDLTLEAPVMFSDLTSQPLPSVALALPPSEKLEVWPDLFMRGLARASNEGLRRLDQLERDFARWQSALPASRSDSRAVDAVVLLGTMHALTPRYIAETLGMTRQAAARILKRLEDYGIVRKATNRQRWLIYLADNISTATTQEGMIPESTQRPQVELEAIDRVLGDAYDALDRTLKRDDEDEL